MNIIKRSFFSLTGKNGGVMLSILAVVMFLSSCGKPEDKTEDIKVESMEIVLDEIAVSKDNKSMKFIVHKAGDSLNSFETTQLISVETLTGMTDEAKQYRELITDVKVGRASIVITAVDTIETGTVVKEFVMKTDDAAISLTVPEYNLGDSYSENVQSFVQALALKLFLNNSLNLNIFGKTDVQTGSGLKVKIIMEDITLIATIMSSK